MNIDNEQGTCHTCNLDGPLLGGAVNIEYGNIKNGNIDLILTPRRGHRER